MMTVSRGCVDTRSCDSRTVKGGREASAKFTLDGPGKQSRDNRTQASSKKMLDALNAIKWVATKEDKRSASCS